MFWLIAHVVGYIGTISFFGLSTQFFITSVLITAAAWGWGRPGVAPTVRRWVRGLVIAAVAVGTAVAATAFLFWVWKSKDPPSPVAAGSVVTVPSTPISVPAPVGQPLTAAERAQIDALVNDPVANIGRATAADAGVQRPAALAETSQKQAYGEVVHWVEVMYPELNPDSPVFRSDLANEVLRRKAMYTELGVSQAQALRYAVEAFGLLHPQNATDEYMRRR